ncbi:MAG: hypothetical protein A2V77_25060 [Anaeromyxobacter sp. RBG_16_69_14]|nr:MAG: hypothetical protein A2V77_25060 [Anaeromyxobacter sp. RBG_16_69_14]
MPTASTLRVPAFLTWPDSAILGAAGAGFALRGASPVGSRPLIASGSTFVGSTPPSGRSIRSRSEPPFASAARSGFLASGRCSEAISSLASAASALAALGFHDVS